jgi:DNA repair protein RadB
MIRPQDKIETGIESLDELLNGGLTCGKLNLIYGEATSGKTTLALTITTNHLAERKAAKCVYIDSDNKLKMDRVVEIAGYRNSSILNRFHLFIPYTFKEQEETLEHLPRLEPSDLVVLDSVTGLYRPETGGEEQTFRVNKELNRQLAYMAELAETSGACFLLTGQVRSILDYNQIEPVSPRLLSYWSSFIIKLEKTPFSSVRNLVLEKPNRPGNVITVEVTDEGMRESSR